MQYHCQSAERKLQIITNTNYIELKTKITETESSAVDIIAIILLHLTSNLQHAIKFRKATVALYVCNNNNNNFATKFVARNPDDCVLRAEKD